MAELLHLGDVKYLALSGVDRHVVAVVTGIDDTMKLLQICLAIVQNTIGNSNFYYPFGEQVVVPYPQVLLNALPEQLGDDIGLRIPSEECERMQDAHVSLVVEVENQFELPTDIQEIAMRITDQFRGWLEGTDALNYFDIPEFSASGGWSSEHCQYFAALIATGNSYSVEERHLQELIQKLELFGDNPGYISDPIVGAVIRRFNNSRFTTSDVALPAAINHDPDDETLQAFDRAGLRTIDELTANPLRRSRGRLVPGTSRFIRFREWALTDSDEIRWSR